MESTAGKLDMSVTVKRVQSLRKPSYYKFDEEKEEIYDCKDKNLWMSLQESFFSFLSLYFTLRLLFICIKLIM